MKFQKLIIEYAGPNDSMEVEYKLREYDIVQRWAERIIAAQNFPYPIDHPSRFYGFGPYKIQVTEAIDNINQLSSNIELLGIKVKKRLNDINDQGTLNYLHSIFEKEHGLLDVKNVADQYKYRLLCDLNLAVHRCESVQRGANPRHVVTYFGLPKTEKLNPEDYTYFTDIYTFGTVYLNYVEIGKTLEDLALDNDSYISRDACCPFIHYSADFNVKFFNSSINDVLDKRELIKCYYNKNLNFFKNIKNLDFDSPLLKPGSLPVADLVTNITLPDIEKRQYVRSVRLYS